MGGRATFSVISPPIVKHLLTASFSLLLYSCSGSEPDEEKDPSLVPPVPEVTEEEIEEPLPPEEDPLQLADPVTTDTLLQEEDKKTVSGPVPVDVPEPPADSTIEIKPPVPNDD